MKNILEYLEKTATAFPNRPAFSDEDVTLTFSDVLNKAKAVGSYLLNRGISKRPVAVFMGKKPDTIAAFLGVVYAGCYYVPIDDTMPKDRVMLIFNKLNPACILAESAEINFAEYGFAGEVCEYAQAAKSPMDEPALEKIRAQQIDTDPIYVVFTSGSTGVPKGVVACHRSVIDYAEVFTEMIGATEEHVFGMQVPLYVDACLKEIFSTLKCGAHTWLIPKSLFMFPVKLVEYLNVHRINTLCWVVSALTMISGLGAFKTCVPEYLHTVAFGSEVFPLKQLNLWREHVPNARYINLYGPTEATGMSCWYELPSGKVYEEGDHVPIGKPFRNTEIILLDDDDRPADEGEICIRGTCLTLGYYDDPERTAAVFCQNPLNPLYPERIYRTGDIARRDEEGNLVFISRKDGQIKHMGHRIELGEIETAANAHESVVSSCCVFDQVKKRITLFYAGEVEKRALAAFLKEKLPVYMLPHLLKQLERIPMTDNGKIDRTALKKLAGI